MGIKPAKQVIMHVCVLFGFGVKLYPKSSELARILFDDLFVTILKDFEAMSKEWESVTSRFARALKPPSMLTNQARHEA